MPRSLSTLLVSALLVGGALASEDADEPPARSSIELELYGYIKLDAAYDGSRSNTGNFVRWIELDPADPNDDGFHMTANQSRFGLRLGGSEEPTRTGRKLKTSGIVEIDFYGGGDANRPRPLLRHAYIDVEWPESGWHLLAGQNWDVFSPLNPTTINYSPAWWAGNVGFRRPQLRLTRTTERLTTAFALTRDIGSTSSDFAAVDSGADAGIPGVQARIAGAVGTATLGLSGHWAVEEFDIDAMGGDAEFDSWSINLDYLQPLGERARLKAELFSGENLAAYLGGIGNGVNLTRMTEVAARGGWIALDLGPYEGWSYHVGASIDDPDDDDLEALDRARNVALWCSGSYLFTDHLQMGVELSYWATDYAQSEEADSVRGQFAVTYAF